MRRRWLKQKMKKLQDKEITMSILTGIRNFMWLLNEHWLEIAIIIGLGIKAYRKIRDYLRQDDDTKLDVAKQMIAETMLKYVCKAENDYSEWVKAGAAKRAQVIDEILVAYPILQTAADRDEIIAWLDDTINDALKTMRKMVEEKANAK